MAGVKKVILYSKPTKSTTMEKIKKLFLLMAILIPAIAFTACGDDDEPEANNELVGTTWKWYNYLYSSFEGGKWYQTIVFTSNSTYTTYYQSTDGTIKDKNEGCKYTFEKPNITLYKSDGTVWNTFILKGSYICPSTNENVHFDKQ